MAVVLWRQACVLLARIRDTDRLRCWLTTITLLVAGTCADRTIAADAVDYERQVKPIFAKKCYACHGVLQQKSNLRLDTAAFIRKGGAGGEAVVPGKPDESLLLEMLTGEGGRIMPPEGDGTPFSAEELELVKRWIVQGATGPADELPQVDPRDYWSYKTPQRAAVPAVKNPAWAVNPIDAFIAAEHDRRGLTANASADKAVWLRRVYLDLIGLPPSRTVLQAFLADNSAEAHEKIVDGLLDSPQYGERWGRHWMDVWRYSDWYGSRAINEIRYSQRHIWRWRDWIVESLNADTGYDQMIVQMLAGDELAPADPHVLRATGYLGRNWYKFDRNVWMFDTVEQTSQAFLGLTLKCCRCHDHKYDPISQEDYYRFRAFFEPHDVRTDRISASAETEKDATLGQVLKEGVARIFDKDLEAKTYVFQRGDNRYPDEKRLMSPGVPAALGISALTIQAVSLPSDAYYPALQPAISAGLVAQAQAGVRAVDGQLAKAKAAVVASQQKLDEFAKRTDSDPAKSPEAEPVIFHDDFSKPRPDVWKPLSGQWDYENGHLIEKSVTSFATLAATVKLPQDIKVRLKYKALEPMGLRSIGFSFDYIDAGNSQDIYTHVNSESQGIQAFHRQHGQQLYPTAGIVKTTDVIRVGEIITVEFTVHGTNLTIWLNGEKKLDYVLPIPRREGTFALWAHSGSAEFHELEIRQVLPNLADLKRDHQTAQHLVAQVELKRLSALAEVQSVTARIQAERAKFSGQPEATVQPLAMAASRAEHAVGVAKAHEAVLQAEQSLAAAQAAAPATPASAATTGASAPPATVLDAKKKLTAAQQALVAAQQAADKPDGKYSPLGDQFPATSTGRRLALARWIADRQNPRTARIAVNHIWLRHFGQALVPSVANFGLNGDRPSHPELLDWLAVELMENGWHMKPLHRLMVLSNTYRMASNAGGPGTPNLQIDKSNRYLWRMNSRRMEAEVVRDSVLSVAGSLNLERGGPEIAEGEGQSNFRRSLYFRTTPNEKMKFLEVFDLADPNACFRRRESVVPNQALALMNSTLALDQARILASQLSQQVGTENEPAKNVAFIQSAFEQILNQSPTPQETAACQRFLDQNAQLVRAEQPSVFPPGGQSRRAPSTVPHIRARENLVHVLLSHNLFVTIR